MKRRAFITQSLYIAAGVSFLAASGFGARPRASSVPRHQILDFEFVDTKRDRLVPTRLYVPTQVGNARSMPLVVFSHGLGGSRNGYQYLGRYWADAGIASVHPQHVGSDTTVWRGNPLELVQRLQSAAGEFEARSRALDLRFVLDQILSSELVEQIDTTKIAVAGHSYGANTAMLVSGARVVTADGDKVNLKDPRIRAAILISAPPLRDQGPIKEVLGAVTIPTLHITSIDDTINLPGFRSTVRDRITIFQAMEQSPRTLAVFNAGGHSIFTDRTTRSGPETSARIKSATRELSTIFLRESFFESHTNPDEEDKSIQTTPEDSVLDANHSDKQARDLNEWLARYAETLDQFIPPNAVAAHQPYS